MASRDAVVLVEPRADALTLGVVELDCETLREASGVRECWKEDDALGLVLEQPVALPDREGEPEAEGLRVSPALPVPSAPIGPIAVLDETLVEDAEEEGEGDAEGLRAEEAVGGALRLLPRLPVAHEGLTLPVEVPECDGEPVDDGLGVSPALPVPSAPMGPIAVLDGTLVEDAEKEGEGDAEGLRAVEAEAGALGLSPRLPVAHEGLTLPVEVPEREGEPVEEGQGVARALSVPSAPTGPLGDVECAPDGVGPLLVGTLLTEGPFVTVADALQLGLGDEVSDVLPDREDDAQGETEPVREGDGDAEGHLEGVPDPEPQPLAVGDKAGERDPEPQPLAVGDEAGERVPASEGDGGEEGVDKTLPLEATEELCLTEAQEDEEWERVPRLPSIPSLAVGGGVPLRLALPQPVEEGRGVSERLALPQPVEEGRGVPERLALAQPVAEGRREPE